MYCLFPSSFNFFSVWLIFSLPLHPAFARRFVHVYMMCVTSLPLPAASCSLFSAKPEPPPCRENKGEVRCRVTNAPNVTLSVLLPCSPPHSVQCPLPSPYLHTLQTTCPFLQHWSSNMEAANLMPLNPMLPHACHTYLQSYTYSTCTRLSLFLLLKRISWFRQGLPFRLAGIASAIHFIL